jgi:hypothetical protein
MDGRAAIVTYVPGVHSLSPSLAHIWELENLLVDFRYDNTFVPSFLGPSSRSSLAVIKYIVLRYEGLIVYPCMKWLVFVMCLAWSHGKFPLLG